MTTIPKTLFPGVAPFVTRKYGWKPNATGTDTSPVAVSDVDIVNVVPDSAICRSSVWGNGNIASKSA